jgi:hypothetical protein
MSSNLFKSGILFAAFAIGGCVAPVDGGEGAGSADSTSEDLNQASQSLTSSQIKTQLVGDYITSTSAADLSSFNTTLEDYASLTLRQDGTFSAVVTARRADTSGHQVELVKGGRFAAEQGTWSVKAPVNGASKATLTINPSGQLARKYQVTPTTSLSLALAYTEIVSAGVVGGKGSALFRAAFFSGAQATSNRLCLGGNVATAAATGPVCAAAPPAPGQPDAATIALFTGDYIQFIDNPDLTIFNHASEDYMSLTLNANGTFSAVVTARRADLPGHQIEVIEGARFAAEQGTWTALAPAKAFEKATLIIRPTGQAERKYLAFTSTDINTVLDAKEILPAGVNNAGSELFRAAFYAQTQNPGNVRYRICLGGTVAVLTPDAIVCQAP